ncbi:methyl-accepting chemotaxis protein [Myxococcus sp. RHSTA-1-4]|uniref:methyl-accepting chemotaxis protein n=1 Tax=Myxococcus sp. RHSTA-1-4 TaxID=2874601 RepID=UPI001CBC00BA|nr:methyl-accepting chemotaxis protein [Myxococcus sp. RHSTA-1-4]MBZ4417348.1 methyl-accepting chemotaxis protein [Myxococcus sp. RHSTA-1-4]
MRFLDGLKLRARLTLAVSLLILCALLPLNLFMKYSTTENLEQQIHATLEVEAEALRDLMEAALAEREANVRSWSEDSILRGALLFDTFEKSDMVLASLQRLHPSFIGLVLFTEDGRAVSASEPLLRDAFAGRQQDVLATPWFRAALEGRLDTSALSQEDPVFKRRVLPFAVPVVSPISGSRIGVLLAAYDWGQVGSVVSAALQRFHARGLRSFGLEVLTAGGASLYDSRPAGSRSAGQLVQASAINSDAVRDVGDGWRFVATVEPEEAYAPLERAETVVLILTVVSILLSGLGAWLLAHGMTRPISTLSEVVGRIVREGDLTQKVQVSTRRDEVGELASAFSRMMSHLRESTASLQQGTRVLGQTVADLTSAAAQQERNLTQQAAALQETQVTAQEIKQTSMMAADRSQAVLGATERARAVSAAGEATVGASLQGFEQLREQVGRVAGSIASLAERTQQIDGITQTVKDLADQSNMLALNAAIESVRSGDHGKGFGVVAREIRSLADQSISSTGRVREILEDIRRGIQATVALSEEGQRRTEAGLSQVRASGDSLRELTGIIQDNANAAQQIAAAVTQQNAGVAQIFTAVTDLSRMMDETMQGLKGTQRTTEALREVAQRMEVVASAYRV